MSQIPQGRQNGVAAAHHAGKRSVTPYRVSGPCQSAGWVIRASASMGSPALTGCVAAMAITKG